MKKRVIVIAKSLHQSRVLKEKAEVMLQMEVVMLGEDDVLDTIKAFQPQHIICYLNRMEENDKIAVADVLKQQGFFNDELILLGTEEECSEFKEETHLNNCIEIKCPISLNKLVLSLESIFDCQCKEQLELDVYKREILVIDDNPLSLKSIKLWLEDAYRVSIVNSGNTALKFLERKPTDLILMDYMMPGMDGKETLGKIRSNPKTKHIPVFFLTGLSDNEKAQEVMELNPQGYFLKTAQKEEVLTAIANFLDVL